MGRHGDYLLTRNKHHKWEVRDLRGRYVRKDVKKQVLKDVFGRRRKRRLYRVIQGYKTGEGETPTGNVRLVTYYDEPPGSVLTERGLRDRIMDSLDRGAPHAGQRRNFVYQLVSRGGYVEEGEWVDAGELPSGYEIGKPRVELFVLDRVRPETWGV